ncbi:MAG: hypothetical protein WCS80_01510 [Bacilli bacterium]
MNKLDIINAVNSLVDEKGISFFLNDKEVTNRFDINGMGYVEDTKQSLISFYLYSLVANAIILKGQGKEKSQLGETTFQTYFSNIVRRVPQEYRSRMENEKSNALRTLDSFLFDLDKVMLPDLLARFSPLVIIDLANENNQIDKKLLSYFDKNKEIIFNQAVLFTRSLFHAFLARTDIDSSSIIADLNNPTDGVFRYGNTLIIPTDKNAFYFEGFKKAAINGLNKISKDFSLDSIDKISLLYLSSALTAEFSF